jgi:N-methylhydantoinase B
MPLSTHIDEEGLRIGPTRLDERCIAWICDRCRTPAERRGDLMAQLAAIDVGVERLLWLIDAYGHDEVADRAGQLQAYTGRIMRSILGELPDGRYEFSDVLDDDGVGTRDIAIRCALTVDGEGAVFDFAASDDQVRGPVNAVRAITLSAVNYCLRCLAPEDLPSNSGVMSPVKVVTRPGSIVDASHPAAVAAGNVETSQRIVDVVLGALAHVAPDRLPAASAGTMNNLAIGGADPRTDEPFTYYETIAGGAGAGPTANGAHAIHTHMTNTLNTPVEALEHAYPLRVRRYAIRRGSGGRGARRGGDGVVRAYEALVDTQVTLLTERRAHRPYGLAGGERGAAGVNTLVTADGQRRPLDAKTSITIERGQVLEIATPGGGGHGRPDDSDPV